MSTKNKSTLKSDSKILWLFALILVLCTLLFCMLRNYRKSEEDSPIEEATDQTSTD